MKYLSTRGGVTGLTFEEALLSGYAADGGILLPESIPKLSPSELQAWSNLTYPQLVFEITSRFISEDEIPRDKLKGDNNVRSYSSSHAHFYKVTFCSRVKPLSKCITVFNTSTIINIP